MVYLTFCLLDIIKYVFIKSKILESTFYHVQGDMGLINMTDPKRLDLTISQV